MVNTYIKGMVHMEKENNELRAVKFVGCSSLIGIVLTLIITFIETQKISDTFWGGVGGWFVFLVIYGGFSMFMMMYGTMDDSGCMPALILFVLSWFPPIVYFLL